MLAPLSRKGIGAKFEGNTNDFQYPDIIEGDSNGLVGKSFVLDSKNSHGNGDLLEALLTLDLLMNYE